MCMFICTLREAIPYIVPLVIQLGYSSYVTLSVINYTYLAKWWWCTFLITAFGRQRKADLCEFKDSLVYKS